MKNKILTGMMLLAVAVFTAACSDDEDYDISMNAVVTQITTGDATVTAISATTYGQVQDLSRMASSTYQVGTVFSTNQDPTTAGTRQQGSIDETGNVTTVISGLTEGTTYYYATFVTLQGKVTKYGEVKSFVATDADVATAAAAEVTACSAVLSGQATGVGDILDNVAVGFKYATTSEGVAQGIDLAIEEASANFGVKAMGLLPATTYYYAAYTKVGDGFILGNVQSFTTEAQEMEYVDLGLSVLWAKCNIGAEKESEAGILVGFGDQSFYSRSTNPDDYTPWDIAGTEEDVIYNLSIDGDNPMKSQSPTVSHVQELLEKTTQTVETVDGVQGVRFTAGNGNSIFIPYAGFRNGSEAVENSDTEGYLWTGDVSEINESYGKTLKIGASGASTGLSLRSLGLSLRSVRPYAVIKPQAGKVIVGDLEGNGRIRIEIYNEYGNSRNNPCVDPSSIKFNKNMVVTFDISGIDGNMKEGARGYHIAGLEYSDPTWGPSYWSSLSSVGRYEAAVTGDGTYTVWMEAENANGAIVFCIDIADLAADAIDPSLIKAEVTTIKLDADIEQAIVPGIAAFQNKDGNGTDGRIEIYNEYGVGGSIANGAYNDMKFNGLCLVEFSISGINGNLIDHAGGAYTTELSFADADWWPSYWGGAGYGSTTVTGDGTYEVYAYLGGNCEGAVVWTIELYNLWSDLVDPSKVQVTLNKILIPGKY